MRIFEGSGVALVTPFNENNEINFDKLRELLQFHLDHKTDAIIVIGTTGESATMTDEEKLAVVKFSVDFVKGRVPVIAGTGSNNTAHAIFLSQEAEKLGADGLLVVTPYYNKGNQNGIYTHYKLIAESVKIPIILYNVPGRTGVSISIDVLRDLAEIRNIVALKEASGDMSYTAKVAREVKDLDIYSGNDDITVPILSIGGKGVISVLANIMPEETHEMVHAFLHNDSKKACEIQLKYNELVDVLFIEVNPVPIKEAMNYLGYNVGNVRLPLGEMSDKNRETLHRTIDKYQVMKWK